MWSPAKIESMIDWTLQLEWPQRRGLSQRLRHQTNSEDGFSGLVQQLHMPFGVLLQAAGNTADEIAADLGHLGPSGLAALELGALIGRAGITATGDPEEV